MAFGHLLITKALKEVAWALKYAFSVFVVKLYSFCLSIAKDHYYVDWKLRTLDCTRLKNVNGCRGGMPKSMQTRYG